MSLISEVHFHLLFVKYYNVYEIRAGTVANTSTDCNYYMSLVLGGLDQTWTQRVTSGHISEPV